MKARTVSVFAAMATVAAGGLVAAGLPGAYADSPACTVQYQVTQDWGSGATVAVTVTNNAAAITHWTLSWAFPGNQRLTNGWNGTYTQNGSTVTVVNASYNGTVSAGGTASTGLNLVYTGPNPAPTVFTFNGQTCGGGTPSPSPSGPGSPSPTGSPTPSPTGSPSPSSSPTPTPTPTPSGSTPPPGPGLVGNATHFDGLGTPYGGCGIAQSNLDSQNFVALNVYNTPGDYSTYYPRPMAASLGSKIGAWDNGRNCGRWVQVSIGDFCTGLNDGAPGQAFCRGGSWVADQYNGATLTMLVADSCGDGNAWCRDDPNHLDLATNSLNLFSKNGAPVGTMYPTRWGNRKIQWSYVAPPNYTGDLRIGFMQNAQKNWPAIAITHLPNGIHGVDYFSNGVWQSASMNSDMGQSYIVGAIQAQGTDFRIRVRDADDHLVGNGRTYSFALPSSCSASCSGPFTEVSYTTAAS